ncbi:MAG TPA: hypothetical protein VII13_05185 [Vicinamibacteria bacterium]|jgi:hypothetical protein
MNPSFLLAFALAAAAGCDGSKPADPSPKVARLDQEFELATGETAVVGEGALRVTFDAVRDDSRCPRDAQCIWEGDATVVLTAVRATRPKASLELHTSRGAKEEVYEGHRLKLVRLLPIPEQNGTPQQSAYRATLVVSAQP